MQLALHLRKKVIDSSSALMSWAAPRHFISFAACNCLLCPLTSVVAADSSPVKLTLATRLGAGQLNSAKQLLQRICPAWAGMPDVQAMRGSFQEGIELLRQLGWDQDARTIYCDAPSKKTVSSLSTGTPALQALTFKQGF